MTDHTKPGNQQFPSYEHQDLAPKGILYFLLALILGTIFCALFLSGVYAVLDRHEKEQQSTMSPLITQMPEDTRHVARGYPQATFPEPKLEEDERGQLNGIRTDWNNELYSYGWVNEPAGAVRIPIDRAMDLLAQRGLPVRSQSASEGGKKETAKTEPGKTETVKPETDRASAMEKARN